MIVVLADDLAGASEMGGMAWRHGLAAAVRTGAGLELGTGGAPGSDVDVVVLDTDTRSCAPAEAARRVFEVAAQCRNWGVQGVYKKVDSVLRGPVAAELTALLDALGFERCLLVPANPGLGRVISGGLYLVNGVPLHETDFRLDPEYPAMTASVLKRVAASGLDVKEATWPLYVRSPEETLPECGIVIGEATCEADLAAWAVLGGRPGVLAAGASEYFGSYLHALGHPPGARAPNAVPIGTSRDLFVCGSTSAGSRAFCRWSEARGVPVLRLPSGLLQQPVGEPGAEAWVDQWSQDIARALSTHPRVIAAIDRPLCPEPGMPLALGRYLSDAVAKVLGQLKVDRLFAEGGATAVELVRRMGWSRMRVQREWATGVTTLAIEGQDHAPLVSIKPGSYVWPDAILA